MVSDCSSHENILFFFSLRSHSEIFDLKGEKTALVLETLLPLPTYIVRPILFILSKNVFVHKIASLLEFNRDAPLATYMNMNMNMKGIIQKKLHL